MLLWVSLCPSPPQDRRQQDNFVIVAYGLISFLALEYLLQNWKDITDLRLTFSVLFHSTKWNTHSG